MKMYHEETIERPLKATCIMFPISHENLMISQSFNHLFQSQQAEASACALGGFFLASPAGLV